MLDGSDEELVAVALVVKKTLDFSVNLVLSEFVPGNVVLGGNKFRLESNSVLLRCDEEFLVQVLDLSEFGNSAKKKNQGKTTPTWIQSIRQSRSFCQRRTVHRNWTTSDP